MIPVVRQYLSCMTYVGEPCMSLRLANTSWSYGAVRLGKTVTIFQPLGTFNLKYSHMVIPMI